MASLVGDRRDYAPRRNLEKQNFVPSIVTCQLLLPFPAQHTRKRELQRRFLLRVELNLHYFKCRTPRQYLICSHKDFLLYISYVSRGLLVTKYVEVRKSHHFYCHCVKQMSLGLILIM
jgi:hypothetical protein